MNRRVTAVVVAVMLALLGTAAVLGYVRSADNRAVAGPGSRSRSTWRSKFVPAGTTLARTPSTDGLISQEMVAAKGVPCHPAADDVVEPPPQTVAVVRHPARRAGAGRPVRRPGRQQDTVDDPGRADGGHRRAHRPRPRRCLCHRRVADRGLRHVQRAEGGRRDAGRRPPAGRLRQDPRDQGPAVQGHRARGRCEHDGSDPGAEQQADQANGATQGPQATTLYTVAVTQAQAECSCTAPRPGRCTSRS